MHLLSIKKGKCPFCHHKIEKSTSILPDGRKIPFWVCTVCISYFYERIWHDELQQLAKDNNRRLNRNIFFYEEKVDPYILASEEEINFRKKIRKQKLKELKKLHDERLANSLPVEIVSKGNMFISKTEIESCHYYCQGYCDYTNSKCQPVGHRCVREKYKVKSLEKITTAPISEEQNHKKATVKRNIHTDTILLSYNKKCLDANHSVIDIEISVRVVNRNGQVIDVILPAVWCATCGIYIVLKEDFNRAKRQGVLLCVVENQERRNLDSGINKSTYNESKVHMLGYNVMKKYDYSYEQRKIILANIIENHDITKHEILSIISANITRHQGQSNYSDAVTKWKQDRDFVTDYKIGSCQIVQVDKIISGRKYN